jgi:hypothetical protein
MPLPGVNMSLIDTNIRLPGVSKRLIDTNMPLPGVNAGRIDTLIPLRGILEGVSAGRKGRFNRTRRRQAVRGRDY